MAMGSYRIIRLFFKQNSKFSILAFELTKIATTLPVRNTPLTVLAVHGSHLLQSLYTVSLML